METRWGSAVANLKNSRSHRNCAATIYDNIGNEVHITYDNTENCSYIPNLESYIYLNVKIKNDNLLLPYKFKNIF